MSTNQKKLRDARDMLAPWVRFPEEYMNDVREAVELIDEVIKDMKETQP